MPKKIEVPHPFRPGKILASAFIVQRVLYPTDTFQGPAVGWFTRERKWRQDRIPTRGEYLIRRQSGGTNMREVSVVLELKPPYLAVVRRDCESN